MHVSSSWQSVQSLTFLHVCLKEALAVRAVIFVVANPATMAAAIRLDCPQETADICQRNAPVARAEIDHARFIKVTLKAAVRQNELNDVKSKVQTTARKNRVNTSSRPDCSDRLNHVFIGLGVRRHDQR